MNEVYVQVPLSVPLCFRSAAGLKRSPDVAAIVGQNYSPRRCISSWAAHSLVSSSCCVSVSPCRTFPSGSAPACSLHVATY